MAIKQHHPALPPRRFLPAKETEENVWDLGVERTRHAFDLHDTMVVSFSGGKDSTAVLNLALGVARERGRLPLHVVFWDEEAIPYQTEEYVRRVAENPDINLIWFCVPIKHRNACSTDSPWWYPWAPEDREKWVRPLPPEGIPHTDFERVHYDLTRVTERLDIPEHASYLFPWQDYGRVGYLMGIRADESMTRRRAVSYRTEDNYIMDFGTDHAKSGNKSKIYPIYDWRTPDVWRAPAMHGWDYNAAYDLMEMAGVSMPAQRIAPPFGEQPMQNLWIFGECFPEIWDRMSERVPGASTGARYSRTTLYDFGSKIVKPDHQSWPEHIDFLLQSWEPKDRKVVASHLKHFISRHEQHGQGDPLIDIPHPITGIGYAFLAKIAKRGDMKRRANPLGAFRNAELESQREQILSEHREKIRAFYRDPINRA